MAISGIGSLLEPQDVTEIERLRRERESKGVLGQMGGGGDTVTLSDEGKRLAAEMQARQAKDQENRNQEEATDRDRFAATAAGIPQTEEEEAEGVAGGRGGSGAGGSGSSQVDQIKKQIQQLEAKMQSVASGGLPENIKESTLATYQAQIAELQSQLQQAQQG